MPILYRSIVCPESDVPPCLLDKRACASHAPNKGFRKASSGNALKDFARWLGAEWLPCSAKAYMSLDRNSARMLSLVLLLYLECANE